MNSPFSNLYEQIMLRIQDNINPIRYINQELGQLENYNPATGRPSVVFPCVLIDFDNFTAEDGGDGLQMLTGEVVIRLAIDTWTPAHNLMTAETREKSLSYFELEFALNQALGNWAADSVFNDQQKLIAHFSSLSRAAVFTEKRDDGMRVRVLKFKTAIEDWSLCYRNITAKAAPELIMST